MVLRRYLIILLLSFETLLLTLGQGCGRWLCFGDAGDSQLGPHELTVVVLIGYGPPEAPSEDALDDVRVIALANKGLVCGFILSGLDIESVRVVDSALRRSCIGGLRLPW